MIVTDERVARFVSEQLGVSICPPFTCMGIERGGAIVGGVIFHCYEGPNVHITVAGKGWTPGFMRGVGKYVYGQLGCLRMTITTQSYSVAKLAQRMGGKVEGRLRDQFGEGIDGIVIGVLKREYKYGTNG